MFWKIIKIVLTGIVVSMFFYPFEFFALPGYNTKKILGAVGVLVCGWTLLKSQKLEIPRNLIPLFLGAMAVSLASMASMAYNTTIDDAYKGYIFSFAVWFSAAFTVCSLIKFVHGYISVPLLSHYLITVSVAQCALALMIDNMPTFKDLVDSYINQSQNMMEEINRLYGIGCGLDTAGIHFSLCLIFIAYLAHTRRSVIGRGMMVYYVFSYLCILVIGSMIARTTYVGAVISIPYIILTLDYSGPTIRRKTLRTLGIIAGIMLVAIGISVYEYNHNPSMHQLFRFAFEGFFNLFEQGEYTMATSNTLRGMYVFPDNTKTWIIGDGYFSNPYWSDPYLTYIDQNTRGYYMDTDVGYLRFIFYFGLIGLSIFSIFFVICARTTNRLMPEHKILSLMCLICGFAVWLKVATDVFFIFALLICVGNMRDEDDCVDETLLPEETFTHENSL